MGGGGLYKWPVTNIISFNCFEYKIFGDGEIFLHFVLFLIFFLVNLHFFITNCYNIYPNLLKHLSSFFEIFFF